MDAKQQVIDKLEEITLTSTQKKLMVELLEYFDEATLIDILELSDLDDTAIGKFAESMEVKSLSLENNDWEGFIRLVRADADLINAI